MLFFSALVVLAQSISLAQAVSTTTTTTTTTTASSTSLCTAGTVSVPSAGRSCTVLCGQDRPGGDYAAQSFASITGSGGCLEACANDPNCATAQYNEANSYCYFKNHANALVASSNTDTIDCSTPACANAVTSSGNKVCTQTCNQDRPGGDYTNFQVSGVNDCTAACLADTNCVSAQYNTANGYCYLKDSVTPVKASTVVDSALCVPNGYCNNADLTSDNNNCGACGNQCRNDEYCSSSICVPRWNLCGGGSPWSHCGASSSCYCWPTAEGDGVCLPSSIQDDNFCTTSADCAAGLSCWGPTGLTQAWGLCTDPSDYTAQCKIGTNTNRMLARGMSLRRQSDSQSTAVISWPFLTITDASGESWNLTLSS